MQNRHKQAGVLLGTMLLSACSMSSLNPWSGPTERSRVPTDATAYACNGGKTLYVRYGPSAQYAMVLLPDREFRLDAEAGPAASKFTNGRTTLAVKDGDVSLEENGSVLYAGCKKAEPKAR